MRTLVGVCMFLFLAGVARADDYHVEPVQFASGRFTLAGALLTPDAPPPHPVIVYVWGAGPTNIQRHIERSQVLKRFLAAGYAVLLYDKPGSGASTGELDNSRLFDNLSGILVDAIAMLGARPGIEPRAIGLYGSSQASYVMATALSRTKDVAFVIAWSCPMQNSVEQSAYLVRHYVLCDGGTVAQADSAYRAYRARGYARTYAEYRAAAEALEGMPAIRDGLGWAGVAPENEFTPPDSSSERFLDPAAAMASLDVPVLALFAENDRQVDPVQGAAAFRRILSGGAFSAVVVIPGADHNMNLSPRGCMQDQRDGYQPIGGAVMSPVFLDTVETWLEKLRTRPDAR